MRAVVTVQSEQPSGTFSVSTDNFVLQDNQGFIDGADTVPSAEQAASEEDITSEADLANGESVDLELTFQVTANVGGQSIFYRAERRRPRRHRRAQRRLIPITKASDASTASAIGRKPRCS